MTQTKVNTGFIAAGGINANTILSTGVITADLIATGNVGSSEIAAGAIVTAKLADSSVTQQKIVDGTITAAKMATGFVNANTDFSSGVITAHAIATGNVVTSLINAGAVTATKIGADAVNQDKIADDSIRSEHINAGAIDSNTFFATNVVDGNAIKADSVGISEINVGLAAAGNVAFTHNAHTYQKAQRSRVETVAVGAANVTINLANTNVFNLTLGTNSNLNRPSNITVGQAGTIFVTQDGTGSRTLSFSSVFDFVGGTAPTISTAASSVDRLDYVVYSTSRIHVVASLAYS